MKIQSLDKPLVSIITPSYNQGQFIEETILSVKNQDYPNIEHIIVDGGSTDNTLEILKKYEDIYNMRWTSESDKGQADAVNKGFGMAQGEVIGWLNSDDVYFTRDVVSCVVKHFCAFSHVAIVYGDFAALDKNNVVLRIQCGMPWFKYKWLTRFNYISQPTVFFKKQVLENHKLDVNLNQAMDYEFWLRLGRDCNFSYLNKIIAGARYHGESKFASGRSQRKKEDMLVRARYLQSRCGVDHWSERLARFLVKVMYYLLNIRCVRKALSLSPCADYAFPIKFDNKFKFMLRQVSRYFYNYYLKKTGVIIGSKGQNSN